MITALIIMVVIIRFVNREEELRVLREKLNSNRFELIVIYGRRRVGKTRLILEAVRGMDHIYYLAIEGDNLKSFKRVASKVVRNLTYVQEDWESYFNFLKDRVVIIDEFPNLVKENPRVISVFQRIVDLVLSNTRTKLVLLGSSISMMSDKVLSYKSPLYGRRTASIKLKPLKFFSIKDFFPSVGWEELIEIYGLTDGIPYYLEKVRTPFWKWLQEEVKRPDTFLKDELDFLMKYEFTEVATYKKILEAIAHGKNTPKEIRDYVKMKHSDIMPYLKNLMDTEFITREVPITENPARSKRGRYYVTDNFIAFWFRYIYPNLSVIEEGMFDVSEIKYDYPNYLGWVFEKVAKQFLIELNKRGKLPFKFTKIGKWWYKDKEIDLVALNERERKALLIEVKWSDLDRQDIDRLITKLEHVAKLTKLNNYRKYYGVIARRVEGREKYTWDLRDFNKIMK